MRRRRCGRTSRAECNQDVLDVVTRSVGRCKLAATACVQDVGEKASHCRALVDERAHLAFGFAQIERPAQMSSAESRSPRASAANACRAEISIAAPANGFVELLISELHLCHEGRTRRYWARRASHGRCGRPGGAAHARLRR